MQVKKTNLEKMNHELLIDLHCDNEVPDSSESVFGVDNETLKDSLKSSS